MSSVDQSKKPDRSELWRSLAELEDKPEFTKFLEREFPEQSEDLLDPVSRRRFMQLMGASLAFAGVAGAGCRWEEDYVVPLGRRPENYVPGKAMYFATSYELGGVGHGVVGKSYDGRPIKIEGNSKLDASKGATSGFGQASVLGLYDPDRSGNVVYKQGDGMVGKSWKDFEGWVQEHFGKLKGSGAGLRILATETSSPTLLRLRQEFQTAFPQAKWHVYESINRDNEKQGTQMAFGAAYRPVLQLDKAKVVLSVDADLFGAHPDALRNSRLFAQNRRIDARTAGTMSRLWAVESVVSTTGAMADHRLPVRNGQLVAFLAAIDAALTGGTPPQAELLQDPEVAEFARVCAKDLEAAGNGALVAVGYRAEPQVHALAAKINHALGASGNTVGYVEEAKLSGGESPRSVPDLTELVKDMAAGKVDTLVMLGGNPVYDAPGDLDFAGALAKVEHSVHLSLYQDETSFKSAWHLPAAHYLESWGDARTWNGTVTLQQPLIKPLYAGRTAAEIVDLLIRGVASDPQTIVKTTPNAFAPGALKLFEKALHDGFAAGTDLPLMRPVPQQFQVQLPAPAKAGKRLPNGELEVVFVASSQVWDGRFANNAWLQEIPDFATRTAWDNYALVSPATAHALGLEHNTLATLTLNGKTVELPVYTMPGQAPFSIAVHLGYGRERAGLVGGHIDNDVPPVGENVNPLRTTEAFFAAHRGAKIDSTGRHYEICNVQDHFAIDKIGRNSLEERLPELARRGTLDEYKKHPEFAKEVPGPRPEQLWDPHVYDGYKWGMATDLSVCTGCSSCVVACQSENNIPVVGKEQVNNNREMQWLRIDRYFSGDKENPEIYRQPVTCQHCENAPCEQVCPVGATIHSSEGLNDMVYNRCVGTRYCLNNCPYKVRRFNFFDYTKQYEGARNKVRKLLFNPEVSVRSRGVMEKCTFCVQRIQQAKIDAHNKQEKVATVAKLGAVDETVLQTACQEACPTGAIVFGDLNDKTSLVSKMHADPRSYQLLGEYLTRPRNLYLARIRNPHPEMPAAHADEAHGGNGGSH